MFPNISYWILFLTLFQKPDSKAGLRKKHTLHNTVCFHGFNSNTVLLSISSTFSGLKIEIDDDTKSNYEFTEVKWKSPSRVQLFATPMDYTYSP